MSKRRNTASLSMSSPHLRIVTGICQWYFQCISAVIEVQRYEHSVNQSYSENCSHVVSVSWWCTTGIYPRPTNTQSVYQRSAVCSSWSLNPTICRWLCLIYKRQNQSRWLWKTETAKLKKVKKETNKWLNM